MRVKRFMSRMIDLPNVKVDVVNDISAIVEAQVRPGGSQWVQDVLCCFLYLVFGVRSLLTPGSTHDVF